MAPTNIGASSAVPIKFTLSDASGAEHHYEATYHRASEGFPLAAQWMTGVLEPLASVLGIEIKDLKLGADIDFSLSANISAGAGAQALRTILTDSATFPLLRSTLANTRRDGAALSSDTVFDTVYRANYAEFLHAARLVAEANDFFGPAAGWIDIVKQKLTEAMDPADSSGVDNA